MSYVKLKPKNKFTIYEEYAKDLFSAYPPSADSGYHYKFKEYEFVRSNEFEDWINSEHQDYKKLCTIADNFGMNISYELCKAIGFILIYILGYDPIQEIVEGVEPFPEVWDTLEEITVPESPNFKKIETGGSLYNLNKVIFKTKDLNELIDNKIFDSLLEKTEIEFNSKSYSKPQLEVEIKKETEPELFEAPKISGKWFRVADKGSGYHNTTSVLAAHTSRNGLGFYLIDVSGLTSNDCPVYFETAQDAADFLSKADYNIRGKVIYPKTSIYKAKETNELKSQGFFKIETKYHGPVYVAYYKKDKLENIDGVKVNFD